MVVGAADEEADMLGTKHFLNKGGRKTHLVIVGEPTSLDLHTASKGDVYCEITTVGKAPHASVPEQGINAVYKMQKVGEKIQTLNQALRAKSHPLLGNPTATVGTTEGGTVTCAVPAFCRITIDRRTLPSEDAEVGRQEIQKLLDKLAATDHEFKAGSRVTIEAAPMEISKDEPLVVTACAAINDVMHEDRDVVGLSALSGASNFVRAGIPAVVLGPGSLAMAHKPDEFVPINEVTKATATYAATAARPLA